MTGALSGHRLGLVQPQHCGLHGCGALNAESAVRDIVSWLRL